MRGERERERAVVEGECVACARGQSRPWRNITTAQAGSTHAVVICRALARELVCTVQWWPVRLTLDLAKRPDAQRFFQPVVPHVQVHFG